MRKGRRSDGFTKQDTVSKWGDVCGEKLCGWSNPSFVTSLGLAV